MPDTSSWWFGSIAPDQAAVGGLLAAEGLFEPLDPGEAARDHGLQALAPLIRRFWPGAKLVPVLASIHSRQNDWEAAAERLAPLVGPRTLVVQSTDFSHYLPLGAAVLRDQESIGVIAAGDPSGVAALDQPGHLDSKASMAIQMLLQNRLGAGPTIIGNRNQVEYGGRADGTTSYVAALWAPDPAVGAAFDAGDQRAVYFAGDALLGRHFTTLLSDPAASSRIVETVRAITRGRLLAINLEGAMLDERPVGAPPGAHFMSAALARPLLADLGVAAAGLANNHAMDLGRFGAEETARLLAGAGVAPLRAGEVHDLGPLRVLPLTLLNNSAPEPRAAAEAAAVETVCAAAAAPPLVVLIH